MSEMRKWKFFRSWYNSKGIKKKQLWHVILLWAKERLFCYYKVTRESVTLEPSQSSSVAMVASRISLSSFWVRFLIGGLTIFAFWIIYTRIVTEDSASVSFKEVRYAYLVRTKRFEFYPNVLNLNDVTNGNRTGNIQTLPN